ISPNVDLSEGAGPHRLSRSTDVAIPSPAHGPAESAEVIPANRAGSLLAIGACIGMFGAIPRMFVSLWAKQDDFPGDTCFVAAFLMLLAWAGCAWIAGRTPRMVTIDHESSRVLVQYLFGRRIVIDAKDCLYVHVDQDDRSTASSIWLRMR